MFGKAVKVQWSTRIITFEFEGIPGESIAKLAGVESMTRRNFSAPLLARCLLARRQRLGESSKSDAMKAIEMNTAVPEWRYSDS